MVLVPLNVFQRLARQWDVVHPYNAAQVLKIAGNPDLGQLQQAYHDTLESLGLGRVRVDGQTFCYECLNGELSMYGVRMVPAGTSIENFIAESLNRRFDNPSEPPFRPFVIPGEGFYYAGVVYHHWIADSVSIRTLLHEWFVRLFDPAAATCRPLKLPDRGYRQFFNGDQSLTAAGSSLLSAARWASALRRVRRVEWRSDDMSVNFAVRHVEPGWIETLHHAAHRRGVTLNDMFLAALARVCDQYVPLKTRPRRHGLALGSIVDLRPYSPQLADAFGLFLGFTNVICRAQELKDPELLLRAVAVQSTRQKRQGIAQTSAMRMLAGVAAARFVDPANMAKFYHKHIPLAGGISNVNMTRTWAMRYHPHPLVDYIRVSPTGPMMPLVMATTTLGRQFHFALTYRRTVVPPASIDSLSRSFVESLMAYL